MIEQDSLMSEQAVLGALLELKDMSFPSCQYAISTLKTSTFTSKRYAGVFSIIKDLALNAQPVDAIVVESLYTKKFGEESGLYSELMDMMRVSVKSNLKTHVNILRDFSIQRVAKIKLAQAIQIITEPDNRTIYEKIGDVESMMNEILGRAIRNESSGLVHARDICDKWSEDLNTRFENPKLHEGLSTGIPELDKVLGVKKLRPGSLVVVGARPKMGKTAFLGSMAKYFALDAKKTTAVFSLEMPSDQIMERMIADRANVSSDIFYAGSDNDVDFARVSEAMGEYINSNLYIDDTPGINLDYVKREARKLNAKSPISLIEVDYLTLMEAEQAERNDLAYGKITKGLKQLAKELKCVVVLLTQLNRNLESRTEKRPMPSDSRDTGQIEQDCDVWIGLYRDEVYHEDSEMKGCIEMLVRLNRHGGTGTALAGFKNGYLVPWQGPKFIDGKTGKQDDDF